MLELFNSNNNNYIYHYLLSISKIQFKGKKMIINIAIDKNTNKILKFYFKNVIDSQNCFKLINDNIKKERNNILTIKLISFINDLNLKILLLNIVIYNFNLSKNKKNIKKYKKNIKKYKKYKKI